jgi:hypothetical protein
MVYLKTSVDRWGLCEKRGGGVINFEERSTNLLAEQELNFIKENCRNILRKMLTIKLGLR